MDSGKMVECALLATSQSQKLARITLNSEATLNSLTLEMIQDLHSKLEALKNDPSIAAIWLEGAGEKAFCAGGDIRRLYQSMVDRDHYAKEFFTCEYALDFFIHEYPKPIFVWGNGIVMGGGLGLFAGAKYRIVTENTKMAMPEISIGLFPDVGGSYFLNRAPGKAGLYLGLTGTRLSPNDCLYAKFADYKIAKSSKDTLLATLCEVNWQSANAGSEIQKLLASHSSSEVGELQKRQSMIDRLLKNDSDLFAIARSFQEALPLADPWLKAGLETFFKGSPTSAHLIIRQLNRSKKLSIEKCFKMELQMAKTSIAQHDFKEGVRALLIDKDHKPKWNPATREEISEADLADYFKE